MRTLIRDRQLVVDLGGMYRSLSSACLGGGIGRVRTWLNLQVEPDYGRLDPSVHLAELAADLDGPVVGMMTAASVADYTHHEAQAAQAWATTGLGHAIAAAGSRPRAVSGVGTINTLAVCSLPLSDAGLAGALQTAVEAKAQALSDSRILAANADGWATGTPTDAICVAAPMGSGSDFAGPATAAGASVAQAVYRAVLEGAVRDKEERWLSHA